MISRFPKTTVCHETVWIVLNEWPSRLQGFWNFSGFPFVQTLLFMNTLRNKVSIQLTCFAYLWLKGHIVFPPFLTLRLSLLQLHSFCCSCKFKLCPGCCECFFFLKTPVLFFSPPILPPPVCLCPAPFPSCSSLLVFRIWRIIIKCVIISNIFFLSFFHSFFLSFFLWWKHTPMIRISV